MSVLGSLRPERVFAYFEEICSVPRGSGDMKNMNTVDTNRIRVIGKGGWAG